MTVVISSGFVMSCLLCLSLHMSLHTFFKVQIFLQDAGQNVTEVITKLVMAQKRGCAQHVSGSSKYVELGLCSIDLWCDVSPKI